MAGNIADNLINFDIRNEIKDKVLGCYNVDFEVDIDWVNKAIYDIYNCKRKIIYYCEVLNIYITYPLCIFVEFLNKSFI